MTSRTVLALLSLIGSITGFIHLFNGDRVLYAAWVIVWAIFLASAFIVPRDQK